MNTAKKIALVASLVALHLVPFAFSKSVVDVSNLVSIDSTPLDRSLNGGVVSYAKSLKNARAAVVSVYSKSYGNVVQNDLFEMLGVVPPEKQRPAREGLGSGVIISENGYILTNNHVVSGADELTVELDGNRRYNATLIGTDPQTDIAVIKINEENLPVATLADSDKIEVGDVVFAIGNPMEVGKTVTMGIVSATGRRQAASRMRGLRYQDFIQTDASINSGNSGGALVDALGRVIGINTMIQTDGRSSGNIGIGFAVPISLAYSVMSDLIESGSVTRGFLGVRIKSLDEGLGVESLAGALVTDVTPDSPAQKAGLQSGDIILEVEGQEIDSPDDLSLTVSQIKPGTEVDIVIVREGSRKTVTAQLALLRGDSVPIGIGTLLGGVMLDRIGPGHRKSYNLDESIAGVVITGMDPASPHADQFSVGMVILKVNGQKVSSRADVEARLNSASKNKLLVAFKGVYRWISVDVE